SDFDPADAVGHGPGVGGWGNPEGALHSLHGVVHLRVLRGVPQLPGSILSGGWCRVLETVESGGQQRRHERSSRGWKGVAGPEGYGPATRGRQGQGSGLRVGVRDRVRALRRERLRRDRATVEVGTGRAAVQSSTDDGGAGGNVERGRRGGDDTV